MRIREATPADVEAIRSVHYSSITQLAPQAYSQAQVDAWASECESADYAAAIDATELAFSVAEQGGEVVGFGSIKLAPPDGYQSSVDAEITGVYVHPSAAREGVGTHLCSTLERRAEDGDVAAIGLTASRNAVPFYETMGYDRVCEHSHEFSSHESTGVTGIVIEMKREL